MPHLSQRKRPEEDNKNAIEKLANNQKMMVLVLWMWLIIVLVFFGLSGGFTKNLYLRVAFGPSPDLRILGLEIDTWAKWAILLGLLIVDSLIDNLIGNIIKPWISNTLADHKTSVIPYNKATCKRIVVAFDAYHNLRSVMIFYLAFSQVDILVGRFLADAVVTYYAYTILLENKEVRKPREDDPYELIPLETFERSDSGEE